MGLSVHDPFVDPLGNPLGLAKVLGLLSINPTIVDFINGAAGDFIIPKGFSFFRVTVVGAGGGTSGNSGTLKTTGTGGGLARSAIHAVRPGITISYKAGVTTPTANSVGESSAASFLDVSLLATGGQAGATSAAGGSGSGGLENSSGGTLFSSSGFSPSGTGAGGTSSHGATNPIHSSLPRNGNNSAGDGGGSGAAVSGPFYGGGGGWMGLGGAVSGALPGVPGHLSDRNANGVNGGGWGGGAGRSPADGGGTGGYGGVRIELW